MWLITSSFPVQTDIGAVINTIPMHGHTWRPTCWNLLAQPHTAGRRRSLDGDLITSCSLDAAVENPCCIWIIPRGAQTLYINLVPPRRDAGNIKCKHARALTCDICPGIAANAALMWRRVRFKWYKLPYLSCDANIILRSNLFEKWFQTSGNK